MVIKMNVEEKGGIGRPKKRWLDTVDTRTIGVCVGYVENRDKWRFRTKVANPKWLGEWRRRRINTS